jgi:hypothetical protein
MTLHYSNTLKGCVFTAAATGRRAASNQRRRRTSHPLEERAGASGDDQVLRDPGEARGQIEIAGTSGGGEREPGDGQAGERELTTP